MRWLTILALLLVTTQASAADTCTRTVEGAQVVGDCVEDALTEAAAEIPVIRDAEHFDELLKPYAGKPLILYLFGTWCGVCKGNRDQIKALHDAYGTDIPILAIANEYPETTVEEVAHYKIDNGIEYVVWHDPSYVVAQLTGHAAVPVTIVYDGQLQAQWSVRGALDKVPEETEGEHSGLRLGEVLTRLKPEPQEPAK